MRIAVLLLSVALVACGTATAAPASHWPEQTYGTIRVTLVRPSGTPFVAPPIPIGNAVSAVGSFFEPNVLQVPLGGTVIWTNRDAIAHTVTSGVPGAPDGTWEGDLGAHTSFAFRFAVAGTFAYYCRFHAGAMHATIVVR